MALYFHLHFVWNEIYVGVYHRRNLGFPEKLVKISQISVYTHVYLIDRIGIELSIIVAPLMGGFCGTLSLCVSGNKES